MGARKTIAHFARHLNEFLSSERGQILSRRGYERAYRFRFSDPMMQPYIIIKGIREGMVSDAAREAIIRREQPFLPNVT